MSPEAVVYRAFTATGRELDAFRLTKGANGLARVDPGHEQRPLASLVRIDGRVASTSGASLVSLKLFRIRSVGR